jgi:paraquat-inducible protein B
VKHDADEKPKDRASLPRPIVQKMRWPFPVIWIVPLFAAIAAGYYAWDYRRDRGPPITIHFDEIAGVNTDDTKVEHRGVEIGRITGIELSDDQRQALVHIRLRRSCAAFANQGTRFWIVRPQISAANITGLGTLVSGPYIEASPGAGDPISDFNGVAQAPAEPLTPKNGLKIVLRAARLEHLEPDAPVYYRGIQVGAIQDGRLSDDATGVAIDALIEPHYRTLVRSNSEFWSVSGADIKGGIITGVDVKLKSLSSLITGGVEFATPDQPGEQAASGSVFVLHNDAKKEWPGWTPKISLPPEDAKEGNPQSATMKSR